MSMNLNCTGTNKTEIPLWQTPTAISYMCYSNNDGGWKGVLYRYTEWVKGHLNGVWTSPEELNEMRERVASHLAELEQAKKDHKQLKFWVS